MAEPTALSEAADRKHERQAPLGGARQPPRRASSAAPNIGLPVVIVALVILLAIAPFDKRGDVSFILDKNKVDEARERMRVEQARYVGEDNKGQKFEIVADRAVQQSSNVPIVDDRGNAGAARAGPGPADASPRSRAATTWNRKRSRSTARCGSPAPTATGLATRDVRVDLD